MQRKCYPFLLLFLIFLSLHTGAQTREITGVVKDSAGTPVQGATIQIKKTRTTVITGADGSFSIAGPSNSILIITHASFLPVEVAAGSGQMDVILATANKNLEEVVVIGYGSQKRQNVTGSVATIKADKLDKTTITSFQQALAGRAPGLLAAQTTGQPGANVSVQIRSNPSFANAGVLYILDGVPVNDFSGEPGAGNRYGNSGVDRSPLNFINPNDIESIEILKDASAASIYGARAGAGVIIITTKKGKGEKPRIEYSVSHAFQQQADFFEVFDRKEYMVQRNRITYEAWLQQNKVAPYGNVDPSTLPAYTPKYSDQEISNAGAGNNAIDAISRKGFTHQHNLSMSGVSGKTKYFISGNYLNQKGTLINSDFARYNGRINLEQAISDKVKAGVNLTASRSNADNAYVGTGLYENANLILAAIYHPPTLPLIDDNGNYTINPEYQNAPNPLSFREITDQTLAKRLLTTAYVEWTLIPNLVAKGNFSFDQSNAKRTSYLPRTFLYGARSDGQASIRDNTSETSLMEYTLNYARSIGDKHNLNVLGGYSYQVTNGDGFSAGNTNFLTDAFLYNNLSLGAAPRPPVGSYKTRDRWASYFARAIYEYDQKYMLTASVRRDGASKFAQNKKYGIFPSVSAGWKISEEGFFDGVSFINFLKLRASYGTTGNSNIGGNANAYYSPGFNYTFGNIENIGVALSQLNNDNLTWETVKEINLGIDFGLFKDRITGSFDYFNKTISDLLTFRPLTSDFPVRSVADNVGNTRSTGWEAGIQSKNILAADGKGFEWSTELTFSHFYDRWVQRSSEALKVLEKYIDPKGPFNGIYGYVSDGIYTTDKAAPAWMPNIIPGTVIIKDLNGYDVNGNLTGTPDGKLSSADMVLLGINGAKYSFGFNNTFRYANFDLNIYMYGFTGPKYNSDYQNVSEVERQMVQFGWNMLTSVRDMWTHDNPNTGFPTGLNTGYESYAANSDFWLEKSNFIRCRNITLGYSFPSSVLANQRTFSGIRVYADVQNPFIITKYRGIDPELQNFLAYPNSRSFVIGLNVNF